MLCALDDAVEVLTDLIWSSRVLLITPSHIWKWLYLSVFLFNDTIKRNTGKYNLPHIRDGVLFNTPEFQIKHQQELLQH